MALNVTQVNQAFLATLGRPAEGSAATWGSTSLSLGALSDSIFIAENTEDFVESLYTEILGRASDAEGKAFWNSLLATTSKEAVLAQFKAAILAAGQADPSNADYQSFIAQNKAFVATLYANLLGRTDAASADAEGVEFWANALASGTSKGALLAQFTAAALSDPNSDDAQTLNAKVNVANAITAKFNNFNADVTADQKKAALDALKATMTEVVAGSTAEDFQERIDTFAGNYQNRVAQVFTTKDDDQLDASEATASTVFSGNVNLIDSTKGTIQTTDSVAGNSNYTDTLRVSVTSDSANKDFSLASNLPTSVSSIEKLIITAGAANVSGTLNGTNYAESANITSTGDVDLKISGDQSELKVTAGDKKDAAITVESGSLDNYTGSAAKDTINVKAGSVKTIDTGAGKDTVEIKGGSIKNEGSIKLGAGDDELAISVSLTKAETLNKISLDGGEGSKDKLTISTDITAVNSITGFETITATASAKISADAANSLTSGTKLSDKSNLSIDMSGKNSLNLKNLGVNKAADNTAGTANVAIDKVAKGEITLTSTANNAIVETITLDATAQGTGPVTINKIGAAVLDNESKKVGSNGDKLAISGTTISNTLVKLKASVAAGETQALAADSLHYVNTKISSADDLASKGTVLGLNLTLSGTSSKALVALNNSSQNKSYIYEITGTDGGALTRDNVTLKAIVDNAINKYDQVSSDTIEFVAGRETDSDTEITVEFSKLAGNPKTLKLGTTQIDGKTIDFDATKIINVNSVNAAFKVSGDGSTQYAADHKININTTGAVNYDVTAAGLDNATVTLALASGGSIGSSATLTQVDVVKLNGTSNAISEDAESQFTSTTKLSGTSSNKATIATTKDLDISNIAKSASTDAFTIYITDVANAVKLTGKTENIAETITLADSITGGKAMTNVGSEDKVNISAFNLTSVDKNISDGVAAAALGVKTGLTKDASTATVADFTATSGEIAQGAYILATGNTGSAALFKVDAAIDNSSTGKVTLLATFDNLGATATTATEITFA